MRVGGEEKTTEKTNLCLGNDGGAFRSEFIHQIDNDQIAAGNADAVSNPLDFQPIITHLLLQFNPNIVRQMAQSRAILFGDKRRKYLTRRRSEESPEKGISSLSYLVAQQKLLRIRGGNDIPPVLWGIVQVHLKFRHNEGGWPMGQGRRRRRRRRSAQRCANTTHGSHESRQPRASPHLHLSITDRKIK